MSLETAALAYFDDHPRLALLLDGDARILRMSGRLRRALGLDEGETSLGSLGDLAGADGEDLLAAMRDALHEPGSETQVLLGISHGRGALPEMAWTFSRSRDGKTIFGAAHETAEQDTGRLVTNRLARENNVLQHVIDNMPVVLWAIDERGTFTLSDGAALAVLGLKPGQVVGMDAFQIYASEQPIVDAIRDALAGQFSCRISPGSGFLWESRYIPLKRADGTVEGVLGFSLDVTDRAQAEDDLRRQMALVQEKESAIESLSTPIMRVWAGVLALPLVGILDAKRIERILATLLEAVVHDQAEYVILDMTGIATVDDTTADHVFKVLRALALLGTQAVVTGIQPAVARALVELGMDLSHLVTLGDLEEAIRFVMKRRNVLGTTTNQAANKRK